MIYKNIFLGTTLTISVFSLSASEEANSTPKEAAVETISLMVDEEELLTAAQIEGDAVVESTNIASKALIKASEGFGIEAAQIVAEKKIEAAHIAAEALVKASKIFGSAAASVVAGTIVEAANIKAKEQKDTAKIAQEALIEASRKLGLETTRQWQLVFWVLISLYAAKTITSALNS